MPVIQFILQRDKYFKPGKNVVNLPDMKTGEFPSLAKDITDSLDLSSITVNDEGHIEIKFGSSTLTGIIAAKTDWHLFDKLLAPTLNDNNNLLSTAKKDPISMLGLELHVDDFIEVKEIQDFFLHDPASPFANVDDLIKEISGTDVSSIIDLDHPVLLSSTDEEKATALQAQNGEDKDTKSSQPHSNGTQDNKPSQPQSNTAQNNKSSQPPSNGTKDDKSSQPQSNGTKDDKSSQPQSNAAQDDKSSQPQSNAAQDDKSSQPQSPSSDNFSSLIAKPSKVVKPFDPAEEDVEDFLDGFEIIEDAETRKKMVDNIIAGVKTFDDATSKQKILREAYDNEKFSTHRDADAIRKPANIVLKAIRNAFTFWRDEDLKNRVPIETKSQTRIAEALEQVKAETNNPLIL